MGFNVTHNGSTWVATKTFKLSDKEKERRKNVSVFPYRDEVVELYRKASTEVIGNKCKFLRKDDLKRVYPYVLTQRTTSASLIIKPR